MDLKIKRDEWRSNSREDGILKIVFVDDEIDEAYNKDDLLGGIVCGIGRQDYFPQVAQIATCLMCEPFKKTESSEGHTPEFSNEHTSQFKAELEKIRDFVGDSKGTDVRFFIDLYKEEKDSAFGDPNDSVGSRVFLEISKQYQDSKFVILTRSQHLTSVETYVDNERTLFGYFKKSTLKFHLEKGQGDDLIKCTRFLSVRTDLGALDSKDWFSLRNLAGEFSKEYEKSDFWHHMPQGGYAKQESDGRMQKDQELIDQFVEQLSPQYGLQNHPPFHWQDPKVKSRVNSWLNLTQNFSEGVPWENIPIRAVGQNCSCGKCLTNLLILFENCISGSRVNTRFFIPEKLRHDYLWFNAVTVCNGLLNVIQGFEQLIDEEILAPIEDANRKSQTDSRMRPSVSSFPRSYIQHISLDEQVTDTEVVLTISVSSYYTFYGDAEIPHRMYAFTYDDYFYNAKIESSTIAEAHKCFERAGCHIGEFKDGRLILTLKGRADGIPTCGGREVRQI